MADSQALYPLLEQTGWIHALARRLVVDAHLAEDLAQDTFVEALEAEPEPGPLRGWLAAVMRNRLAKLRRGERNRRSRDLEASREERLPSTLDVVERAATHRDVVLAVLALDEPYRSTLLMRFFEQLSYGEIARRCGITRAAVNSRITRGLERLRARLESTYGGDRRALCLALTPLAKLPTGIATTLFGVKLMHLALASTAAALVAVSVSVGSTSLRSAAPTPALPSVASAEPRPSPELRMPLFPERVPLVEPGAPLQQRERQQKGAHGDDARRWRAELDQSQLILPKIQRLGVNTGAGDVEVLESLTGRLEIHARVEADMDRVRPETLTQVFADHVNVREEDDLLVIEDGHKNTSGWSVSFVVRVPANLPLSANSGSGDVTVRRARGKVSANTGSGDILVSLPGERLESLSANTGSGEVSVEVLSVETKLDANAGSGDVAVALGDAASPGGVSLNSGSGDLLLVVPPGISGTFDLETNGSAIEVPRGLPLEVRNEAGGRRRALGTIASGPTYRLRSGSGSLRLEFGTRLPQ